MPLPSSSGVSPPPSPFSFYVKTFTHYTLELHGDPRDTVESVHLKIRKITGIPVSEQRLIYRGNELQFEQTLAECDVQQNAFLQLVGRMRGTELVNDVVSSVKNLLKILPLHLYKREVKSITTKLSEFLIMTPKDSDKASEYLQIFNASSAPKFLVMLYASDHEPNKEAAYDAINEFLLISMYSVPHITYASIIPILLEFCGWLKRATGVYDSLYCSCRSSLIEAFYQNEGRESIGLLGICPVVRDLALTLSNEFSPCLKPDFSMRYPFEYIVSDFSKLLAVMRNTIARDNNSSCPIEIPLTTDSCKEPLLYAEEIVAMHGIFEDLLSKIDVRLEKFDDYLERTTSCSYHYLSVLKELNSISKMFSKCEEFFWETMKRRKDVFSYLIIRDAKRSNNHEWIIEHKEVTNFESRTHLAMLLLPEVEEEYEEPHRMLIDRANLLSESFEYIGRADPESLRSGLSMEFKNEEALGHGILREWFLVVCRAIFNPQNALFVECPNDHRKIFPNPASKVEPLHLQYFKFSGRIIALALMHKIQIGIVFDRVFHLLLAENKITLEDIRDADPYLHSSYKQILSMDPDTVDQDTLGLTFVYEVEELGSRKVIELCDDGKNLVVNSKNRVQYVDSLIQHQFVVSIAEQVAHFSQGFSDIMICNEFKRAFFRFLDPEDLDSILYGSEEDICVRDWKEHTEYHGFKETDAEISWFWQIVESLTPEQKRVLLVFWTSIKFLPVEGFRGLASLLYIYKTLEPSDRLPSSHTCFFRLSFPAYPTLASMRDRLLIITQEHVGCSFGTL